MIDRDINEVYAELAATREERRTRPPEPFGRRRVKKPPYPEADLADLMLERMPTVELGEIRHIFGSRTTRTPTPNA